MYWSHQWNSKASKQLYRKYFLFFLPKLILDVRNNQTLRSKTFILTSHNTGHKQLVERQKKKSSILILELFRCISLICQSIWGEMLFNFKAAGSFQAGWRSYNVCQAGSSWKATPSTYRTFCLLNLSVVTSRTALTWIVLQQENLTAAPPIKLGCHQQLARITSLFLCQGIRNTLRQADTVWYIF